jgi:glycosyltransferase involved in cell wall biosynthesis
VKLAVVNATNGGLSGGSIKYLRNLIPLLELDSRVSRLDVFAPAGYEAELADAGSVRPIRAGDAFRGFSGVRVELHSLAPDVIFVPNARRLPLRGIPQVTMIRNMEPLVRPVGRNSVLEAAKNLLRAKVARQAARKSDRVIAVSEFVRKTIVGEWRIPADRIDVVYHGVDEPAAMPHPIEVPAALAALVAGKFILSVGSIRPYRGLEDAIRALAQLPAELTDWKLAILGAPDAGSVFYERELRQLADELNVADRVVWAGSTSPGIVTWCLRNCGVFVLTSRIESCPNSGLEALSLGCSCAVSMNDPMPEFFSDVALYYEPGDTTTLARQLADLANEPTSARLARAHKGRERSREFTWQTTAKRTLDALERALLSRHSTIKAGGTPHSPLV